MARCVGATQVWRHDARMPLRLGRVAQGCGDVTCGRKGAAQVRRDGVGAQRYRTWVLGCYVGTVERCVVMWARRCGHSGAAQGCRVGAAVWH
ncbi:hypothetical protein GUJ93_ZPchr0012g22113 [Zizania palustris]|uniref:Uncharacterized protein n=1 Tax=Zizania palustris TaxID=103762 RepID=A0A8J6BSI0_ZIZPA|nr:hypothetical protein GUJ93_ZPchr0012g22113 [Zizania palustris]